MREAGVSEHVRQSRRADPTRAQVLVAVRARASLGSGVVEMDHDEPSQADPVVEVAPRGRRSRAACPGRYPPPRRVRCPGRSRRGRRGPPSDTAVAIPTSSSTHVPRPPPLPAEFSRTSIVGSGGPRTPAGAISPRAAVAARNVRWMPSASRSIPAVTPSPRCEPMWTLTKRAPNVGACWSSWASSSIERSKKSGIRPGEVDEVGRVDRRPARCRARAGGPGRRPARRVAQLVASRPSGCP